MTVKVSLMLMSADTAPDEVHFIFLASAISDDGLHGIAIAVEGMRALIPSMKVTESQSPSLPVIPGRAGRRASAGSRTGGRGRDGVNADELGLGLGIFVLEDEVDDFDEIVVQLVEGVGMGVSAQEGRDVADVLPGDQAALDDGGVGTGADGERSFQSRFPM